MDEQWIMTVKGLNSNNKTSVLTLDEASFSNDSANSNSSSRDVNLNHLKIVHPTQRPKSFSPTSSPTREVPESPTNQKSVIHLKEKKDERFVIESTIETVKSSSEDFTLRKSYEKKEFERSPSHEVNTYIISKFQSIKNCLIHSIPERSTAKMMDLIMVELQLRHTFQVIFHRQNLKNRRQLFRLRNEALFGSNKSLHRLNTIESEIKMVPK